MTNGFIEVVHEICRLCDSASMRPGRGGARLQGHKWASTVRSFADRAELLRRMTSAYFDEEPSAEKTAIELLAFYPASSEAHAILGRLYKAAGRTRDANRHFDAAIKRLTDKRDHLYFDNFVPQLDAEDPMAAVRALRAERDNPR